MRGLCPLLILISASAGTILSRLWGGGCRQLGSGLVLYVFHCIIVSCLALPCCRKGAVHMHSGETVLQFHAREKQRGTISVSACLPRTSLLPLAEQLTARQMEMPRLLGYCCQQLKDFICSLLLPHLLRVFAAATAVSI